MRYLTTIFFMLLQVLTGRGQPTDIHGTWTAELRNGEAFLQVRTTPPPDWDRSNGDRDGGWNMGQSFPIDQMAGLPANNDQLTAAAVKFELRREAGTLAFDGSFRDGRGAGLFTFAPRDAYVTEMKSLGYNDDLPLWRRYQLAVHDVGPRYIRDLKTEGYDKLTLDQVQRAKSHGVTIDYIRGIKGEGFRTAQLETLVRTRDHGVTAEYIKAMKAEGYGATTLEEFVRTRDHGVSSEFIADMKQLGLKDLTLSEIARLRDHGVTPGFVNHAKARGFTTTDPEELIRLKNGGLWKH